VFTESDENILPPKAFGIRIKEISTNLDKPKQKRIHHPRTPKVKRNPLL